MTREKPALAAQPPGATPPEPPAIFRGRLKVLYPLYRSFQLWSDADGLRMSAAMSFYGILSLAPLLVLIVGAIGWWLDREVFVNSITQQIAGVVGERGAEVARAALESAQQPRQGIIASVLAFGLLLMGATGVFAELQSAFERLWTQGSGQAAKGAWWHTATLRLRGVAYVLAIGFLMLVSLVISSLLNVLEHWGGERMGRQALLAVLNQAISLAIIAGLFVALMRMSSGPKPRLRYLIAGSLVGAVLFGLGKYGLALYLSTAAVVSAYGAAGSLVVLLMWIYFASAVLLYAASCARVLAEQQGAYRSVAAARPIDSGPVPGLGGEAAVLGPAGPEEAALVVSAKPVLPAAAAVNPLPGWLAVAAAVAGGYAMARRVDDLAKEAARDGMGSPTRPEPRGAARKPRHGAAAAPSGALRLDDDPRLIALLAGWVDQNAAREPRGPAAWLAAWRRHRSERAADSAAAALDADVRALRRAMHPSARSYARETFAPTPRVGRG